MINENLINNSKTHVKHSKDIDDTIRHYLKCYSNNNWKGFDFQLASAILLSDIENVLDEYGFFGKEEFILYNLVSKFPCLNSQEIGIKQEVHREHKIGYPYYTFDCPYLCAYKELEAKRFCEMQNKYKDNFSLLYLQDIYRDLKATMNVGINSEDEAIDLLLRALYARSPKGAIFNLDVE